MKMAIPYGRRTCGQRFTRRTAVILLLLVLAVPAEAVRVHAEPAQAKPAALAEKTPASATETAETVAPTGASAVSPTEKPVAAPAEPSAATGADLEAKWGITVLSTRLTAAGCMIDFRYRVLDAQKAAKLSDPHVHPYIIDEATGARFIVPAPPKVGQMRNTRPPIADRNYFILFANPANHIKTGGNVTVVIGDLKIEHLVVE